MLPRCFMALVAMSTLPLWAADSVFVERAFDGSWAASFPPSTQVVGTITFSQISDASGPALMDGLAGASTAAARCPPASQRREFYAGTYDYSTSGAGGSVYACTNGSTFFGVYRDSDNIDDGTFLLTDTNTGSTPTWSGTYTDSSNQTAGFRGQYLSGGIATPLALLADTLRILPDPPLPTAFVGKNYSLQLLPSSGSAASWEIVAGALPPGLQLSPQTGSITGTPTQPGTFVWTVLLQDFDGESVIREYSILVGADPNAPAELDVAPRSLSFSFSSGAQSGVQGLRIHNTGGGAISVNIESSTRSGGDWLTPIPNDGIVTAEEPLDVLVRADPAQLGAGAFLGSLAIAGEPSSQDPIATLGETINVPVSMSISARRQFLRLSLRGLAFTAVKGGGNPPPLLFDVINDGVDPMPFTAAVASFPSASWLQASGTQGTVAPQSRRPVTVRVNPGNLNPGVHFGVIEARAAGAAGEVRLLTVVLNLLAEGSRPPAVVEPTGLLFLGTAGASTLPPQSFEIANVSATPFSFTSERLTEGGTDPFTHTPVQGQVLPSQPFKVTVQPSIAGLSAGVYRTLLALTFADDTQRVVDLTLVLGAAGGVTLGTNEAQAACPSALQVTIASFSGGYPSYVEAPAFLRAQVADDCGQPFVAGQGRGVRAERAGQTVFLSHKGSGTWEGTLDFGASGPQGTGVNAEDLVRGITGNTAIANNVQPQLAARPAIFDGGVVHGASFAKPPMAPGSIISVFGEELSTNLDPARGAATALPLPVLLEGTRVRAGNVFLPLFFSWAGQANAGLPLDIDPNAGPLSVVTFRGSIPSDPAEVSLAAANPGLFTISGTTEGIFQDFPGFRLISKTVPDSRTGIAPGERLILYATGLGAVSPTVPSGQPAGGSPPSTVTGNLQLTIGGQNAIVEFAGLTAGLVSLYQVNAIVPAGLPPGDAEVTLTVNGVSSLAGITLSIE